MAGDCGLPLVFTSRRISSMEALLTSTATVALAEIGDKTQLLSFLLAARFKNKSAIIAGILVATLINHGISAWLGEWAADAVQGEWVNWLVGGSFIAIGLWILIPDKLDEQPNLMAHLGAFGATTILFFLAEIGDKTQVATVVLGSHYQQLLWVTLGTTLGMLAANIPAIWLGDKLLARLPLTLTRSLAALLFIVLGVVALLF